MKKIDLLYLIDDDDVFMFLSGKLIKDTQLVQNVKLFANGLEAINQLNSAITNNDVLPDIIFLDLAMPVMDGWGFLEEYIKIQPQLGKVVTMYIVSTMVSDTDVARAAEISDKTGYMIKPITKEVFTTTLKTLLEKEIATEQIVL